MNTPNLYHVQQNMSSELTRALTTGFPIIDMLIAAFIPMIIFGMFDTIKGWTISFIEYIKTLFKSSPVELKPDAEKFTVEYVYEMCVNCTSKCPQYCTDVAWSFAKYMLCTFRKECASNYMIKTSRGYEPAPNCVLSKDDISIQLLINTESGSKEGREDWSRTVQTIRIESNRSYQHLVDFINNQEKEYNKKNSFNRRLSFRWIKSLNGSSFNWSESDMIIHTTFNHIFHPQKELLVKYIQQFKDRSGIFEKTKHKMTILMSGLPGCGKTSFVRAMAKDLERDIINLNLSQIPTKELFDSATNWTDASSIYLYEDVTCDTDLLCAPEFQKEDYHQKLMKAYRARRKKAFKKNGIESDSDDDFDYGWMSGRQNTGALTKAHLLNYLDGTLESPGRIIVITTNHPEKLDPIVIRPGRITLHLKFDYSTEKQIQDQTFFFFGRYLESVPTRPLRACEIENAYIHSNQIWDRYVELLNE